MRRALGLVVTATMLLASTPAAGKIYRWVDEQGITHLDDVLDNVPEAERPGAKTYHSKPQPPAPASGSTQAAFANAVARELGLIALETQDAVSALHIVGIYPRAGWNPTAALSSSVVDEVTQAARAAARARRLSQGEGSAEAAVLRVSAGLGVAGPPPAVAAPEPAREAAPTIVVAPSIIVESPPSTVVVRTIERERVPALTRYGWDPAFGATLFAPIRRKRGAEQIPDRITPLSSPAGRLQGPAVPPRPAPGPFRRPPTF